MDDILLTKLSDKDVEIDYSLSFPTTSELDQLISESENKIVEYNNKIKNKTFSGDWIDVSIAAASGALCGILDAIFLRNIDLTKCGDIGTGVLEPIIKRAGKSNDLSKAIKNLENASKGGFASDLNLADFGGGLQHHLRDFAHHFSPLGLFFSLLTQFTGNCYGVNTAGQFIKVAVTDTSRIGTTFGQKLSNGFVDWFIHLASDMLGTSTNVGRGTGIPGPMLSLAKELSSVMPKGKEGQNELSFITTKIFNGTLFADHDEFGKIIKGTEKPLDFRAELGMGILQSIPVALNMVIVRVFYFVRRLIEELKKKKEERDYRRTFPFANANIIRMTTIANGAFEAVDLGAAIITSAVESAGNVYAFIGNMILNVNFVGIGRLGISGIEEVALGISKHNLNKKKFREIVRLTNLYEAKIYANEGELWLEMQDTEEAMNNLEHITEKSANALVAYANNMQKNLDVIENDIKDNEELKKYILDGLES